VGGWGGGAGGWRRASTVLLSYTNEMGVVMMSCAVWQLLCLYEGYTAISMVVIIAETIRGGSWKRRLGGLLYCSLVSTFFEQSLKRGFKKGKPPARLPPQLQSHPNPQFQKLPAEQLLPPLLRSSSSGVSYLRPSSWNISRQWKEMHTQVTQCAGKLP
jgi:hypothetical protein